MEGSESIHRAAPPELALRLQRDQQQNRRPPMKKRSSKAPDDDQIELHDEKILPVLSINPDDEAPHLDISA